MTVTWYYDPRFEAKMKTQYLKMWYLYLYLYNRIYLKIWSSAASGIFLLLQKSVFTGIHSTKTSWQRCRAIWRKITILSFFNYLIAECTWLKSKKRCFQREVLKIKCILLWTEVLIRVSCIIHAISFTETSGSSDNFDTKTLTFFICDPGRG